MFQSFNLCIALLNLVGNLGSRDTFHQPPNWDLSGDCWHHVAYRSQYQLRHHESIMKIAKVISVIFVIKTLDVSDIQILKA